MHRVRIKQLNRKLRQARNPVEVKQVSAQIRLLGYSIADVDTDLRDKFKRGRNAQDND